MEASSTSPNSQESSPISFPGTETMSRMTAVALVGRRAMPNHWDLIALAVILAVFAAVARAFHGISAPLPQANLAAVSLDYSELPYYALRTTLRMLLATASLIFTFAYAALAAKSRRAEMVLIPLLDILQSVPVLGFLTFTVVFFMGLFPGRVFGAEFAAIFAIFTSQAWNMTFSLYQSIRTVPRDLEEASQSFHLTGWQRFWRLDVPFAMPGLIWNTMMSMSGGWFFVVASEAITVGNTTMMLPGIGSYVALGNQKQGLPAIVDAVLTMVLVIVAYDQLLFRPVVAWADKFRFEQTARRARRKFLDARPVSAHPRLRALSGRVRGAPSGRSRGDRLAGTIVVAEGAPGARAAPRAWSMRCGLPWSSPRRGLCRWWSVSRLCRHGAPWACGPARRDRRRIDHACCASWC